MPLVSSVSFAVWIGLVLAYGALAILILARKAERRWMALLSFALISSLVAAFCIAVYCAEVDHFRAGHKALAAKLSVIYFWTYWIERVVLSCVQFAIVWEVARELLSTRRWRARLLQTVIGVTVIALVMSALTTLSSLAPLYVAVMRITALVDRWLSFAACLVFCIVAFSLDCIGIRWRRETLLVGTGLALQGAIFTAFSWILTLHHFTPENLRSVSFLRDCLEFGSVLVWIAAFLPKPQADSYRDVSEESLSRMIESMKSVGKIKSEVDIK